MIQCFFRQSGLILAMAGFVLLGVAGSASAESGSKSFAHRIAGSYLIQHDTSGSRDVLTINADGVFLMTSSDAGAFQFGNSQGAWKRIGRRTIAAKVVNFDFDDNGVAIVRFEIAFDRRAKKVTGSFSGEVVDAADSDPLKEETVLFSFSDTFDGQRITAEGKRWPRRDRNDRDDDDKDDDRDD